MGGDAEGMRGENMPEKVKWLDEECHICKGRINSWDKRCGKALGYRQAICEDCIIKEYDVTIETFRSIMNHHFGMVPCLGL